MVTALALDPGRTTGYALGWKGDELFDVSYSEGEFSHLGMMRFLRDISPNVIVYETFEFRQKKQDGVDLYPVEMIGIINLYDQQTPGVTVYTQEPWIQGNKTNFFKDARLKEMDLYLKGIEHGRSAVKHLLHWFYFGPGGRYFDRIRHEPPVLRKD